MESRRSARQHADFSDQQGEPIAAQQLSEHLRLNYRGFEGAAFTGLREIELRRSHCAHDRTGIGVTGQNQANCLRITLLDLGQQLPSVHTGHTHIRDDDIRRGFGQRFQRGGTAR